jgi:DNA topoisomerase IB
MGTRLAVDAMKKIKAPLNEKEYKKAVKEVATQVSSKLGNTPTIALQSYINPSVWGQWRKKW